jgi:hypothetical protein
MVSVCSFGFESWRIGAAVLCSEYRSNVVLLSSSGLLTMGRVGLSLWVLRLGSQISALEARD